MPQDLESLLENSGAILHGHFQLSSGRHSDVYFEKFRILEQPVVLSALCASVAERFRDEAIDLVVGPTTGGIIIAFEVGRQMGLPTRYIETENGRKTFRRDAEIPAGSRVLIVDDVLTTGLSLTESAAAVVAAGGQIAAYAVLIDRSLDFHPVKPLFASFKVEAKTYAEDENSRVAGGDSHRQARHSSQFLIRAAVFASLAKDSLSTARISASSYET